MKTMKPLACIFCVSFWGATLLPCLAQPAGTNLIPVNMVVSNNWASDSNRWSSVPFAQTQKAADQGAISAEYYLGFAYSKGKGVAKDPAEALKWTRLAADQGYAEAQLDLGWRLENGDGVPQDSDQAAKYYRLAADQGNARAKNNLGYCYYRGTSVPSDPVEAVKWYQKSADQGDDLGECNLGWMYGHGEGVPKNYDLAEKWMQAAAAQGSPRLQCLYADLLVDEFDKDGHQIANFTVAGEWYRKAADQGYAKAEYELADLYNTGKLGDDQRAQCIPWFLKAAAQGNADAQAEVGELPTLYPNSELLKSVNIIGTLRQGAEAGNLEAQYNLSKRYQTGDGVPKDLAEAFKWMQMAAQHDESLGTVATDAHYQLGVMYEKGQGVAPDPAKAYLLYQEAAGGYLSTPDVLVRLGQMYEKGEGVPQDDHQAAENYYSSLQFGFLYGADNTPRTTAMENLLNLYLQGRGLPDDKSVIASRLAQIEQDSHLTPEIQFKLGQVYYEGKLVARDIPQAEDCFNQSASQGFAEAINQIGAMWAAGTDGAPDPKEAVNWYQKAAIKGLGKAQFNLGMCYAKGDGVSPDRIEAWKWLELAAEKNVPQAAEERDKVQAAMTDDQLKEAHDRKDLLKGK